VSKIKTLGEGGFFVLFGKSKMLLAGPRRIYIIRWLDGRISFNWPVLLIPDFFQRALRPLSELFFEAIIA